MFFCLVSHRRAAIKCTCYGAKLSVEIYWGGKGQIKCPSSYLLSASLLTVLLHAPLKAILSFSSFLWGMFHFPLFMYLRLSSFIQDILKDENPLTFVCEGDRDYTGSGNERSWCIDFVLCNLHKLMRYRRKRWTDFCK